MVSIILSYPQRVLADLRRLHHRARHVGWRMAWSEILHPTAPGTWQLSKYVFIGASSVLVFYGSYGLFRLLVEGTWPGVFISRRLEMNMAAIFVAFVPTNWFTYSTNRRWIFTGGRHAQKKEFTLFTLAAASSFLASQFLVAALVLKSPLSDLIITLLVIVASTTVNFAFRKYVVFHS